MKKTAYKILMWWCVALVVVGIVILATGHSWGILQIAISAGLAYSAYRKVKAIEEQQSSEELPDVSYHFPNEVDLGNDEYLEKVKLSDEFQKAIGLTSPIYVRKKKKKEKKDKSKDGMVD